MVREEIIAGLKNAVLRGESLEKAVQSMISAGYSSEEVREAGGYINMGALGAVQAGMSAEARGEQAAEAAGGFIEVAKKKKKTWLIVLLAIVLLLLIGGITVFILFGDKILSALFP